MIRKFLVKTEVITIFTLLIFYIISRLYLLTALPIFTDESIYIYWAKYIAVNHSHWFLSLTDGKPPLLVWAIASLLTFFPNDAYLIAGRLPSVFAGAMSVIGLFLFTNLLFKSVKASFIAGLLYIATPFTLFYDRLALFDSILCAMLIWSVYFAFKTSITLQIKDAIFWGLFLGLAFLSKPTAIIFLFLTPLFAVFYKTKLFSFPSKKMILLSIVALGISQIINNIQRLSSAYPQAAIKNKQFQQPLEQLIADPFQLTGSNLHGLFSWIISYYTVPVFLFGLFCFVFLIIRRPKIGIIFLTLWFAPIFIFATVGREIFPRYILFTTSYFFIPIAYVINVLLSQKPIYRLANLLLVFFIFSPSIVFSYTILSNPVKAPLPPTDYHQYIADHPSGYGLASVFEFLNKEAQKGNITVVVQGTFGLYPYAFNLEYWDNPKIKIMGRWPLDKIDDDIKQINKQEKVYVVLKEHEKIPEKLPLKLVFTGEKPSKRYPILVTTLRED